MSTPSPVFEHRDRRQGVAIRIEKPPAFQASRHPERDALDLFQKLPLALGSLREGAGLPFLGIFGRTAVVDQG